MEWKSFRFSTLDPSFNSIVGGSDTVNGLGEIVCSSGYVGIVQITHLCISWCWLPGNSFTALQAVVSSEPHKLILISKYANYILSGSSPMDFLLFAHSFQYFWSISLCVLWLLLWTGSLMGNKRKSLMHVHVTSVWHLWLSIFENYLSTVVEGPEYLRVTDLVRELVN